MANEEALANVADVKVIMPSVALIQAKKASPNQINGYCVNQIGNLPVASAHCRLPVIALSHLINVVDRRWWCPTTLVEDKKEKLIEQVSRTVAILIIC